MNKLPSLVLLLVLGALATACGSDGAEPGDVTGGPGAQAAPAAAYVVTGVTDAGKDRPLVPGSEIRFTFDDGRLGIRAGCNSMSGATPWTAPRCASTRSRAPRWAVTSR